MSFFILTNFLLIIITIIILVFSSSKNNLFLQQISIVASSFLLILSALGLVFFDSNNDYFQYYYNIFFFNKFLNLNFIFALDGISILFFFLSSLLNFFCVITIKNEKLLKENLILLFLILLILLIIFSTLDLFLFYVFFEALLIPMYLLIGFWGSRERKVRASYLLFFYTISGSILMLFAILYIYIKVGTLNFESLNSFNFSFEEQIFLWLAFFFSFASKIPMFPFHIWLPEAHVEAPTVGSILLAGILLKLGVYGLIRYNLTIFSLTSHFFIPLIYLFSIISIIIASLNAIRQTDLKRIIAYSSIAHMNIVVLGIFSLNVIGIIGSILQSISHGFVASSLFLLVGIIYNKYHNRNLHYYSGLVQFMPIYSFFFLFFILSNIAFPGTSSFIGEFLILVGLYKYNKFCSIIAAISVILSGAYSLWMYNRIIFGNLKSVYTLKYMDITLDEFFILISLTVLVLYMGIFPEIFLKIIFFNLLNLTVNFL